MSLRRMMIVSGSSLCAVSLWLIVVGLPQCASAEIPEPVRRALESNASSLSPITVAWERTRINKLPRPGTLSFPIMLSLPQESQFMWDRGRFYTHTESQILNIRKEAEGRFTELTDAPPHKVEVDIAFDGQKRYCGTRQKDSPPMLIINTPTNIHDDERFLDSDFFYQTGFHFPERAEDYVTKRPAISLPLHLVEQGASVIEVGREEVDGVSCTTLVLRSGTAEYRFVLDPAKGYAVRRRFEKTPSGKLVVRADCSDFAQVPGSRLWIPKKVEVEWHTWFKDVPKPVKEVVVSETYRVSELKSQPIPPKYFSFQYNDPGTSVADGTLEGRKDSMGRVSYVVPADPSRLDEVIRAAASGKNYEPAIASFRRNFILANVLLILILIGVAWWRVRPKPR